jgi:hypothetical protein
MIIQPATHMRHVVMSFVTPVSPPYFSTLFHCLLKEVIEGKIKGRIEVTRRRGRRRKQLMDDLGDRRGYSHLKEEALDRIKWRNRFGRGCGPVV